MNSDQYPGNDKYQIEHDKWKMKLLIHFVIY